MQALDGSPDNSRIGQLHFRLNCRDDCVHVLRSMVEVIAARAGLDDVCANRVALAVDELYANIVRHGYHGAPGPVEFETRIHRADGEEQELLFVFRDFATPLTDTGWKEVAHPLHHDAEKIEPGGLGVHLIHSIMDRVEHEALPDGNRWLLIYQCKGALDETGD